MDGKTGVISKREKTKKKEAQRLPLSLSALQVAAGKAYGYDPQQVLDTAQNYMKRNWLLTRVRIVIIYRQINLKIAMQSYRI